MAPSIVLRPVQVPRELCLARVSSELASRTGNPSMDAINEFVNSNVLPIFTTGSYLEVARTGTKTDVESLALIELRQGGRRADLNCNIAVAP